MKRKLKIVILNVVKDPSQLAHWRQKGFFAPLRMTITRRCIMALHHWLLLWFMGLGLLILKFPLFSTFVCQLYLHGYQLYLRAIAVDGWIELELFQFHRRGFNLATLLLKVCMTVNVILGATAFTVMMWLHACGAATYTIKGELALEFVQYLFAAILLRLVWMATDTLALHCQYQYGRDSWTILPGHQAKPMMHISRLDGRDPAPFVPPAPVVN